MRLIDADSLKENLSKWLKQVDPTHPQDIPPMDDIIVSTIMTIEEEPTVNAELVRHGKWVIKSNFDEKVNRNYQHVLCSECKTCVANDWEGKLKTTLNYKYCPTCGAKMDAEKEEECGHQ